MRYGSKHIKKSGNYWHGTLAAGLLLAGCWLAVDGNPGAHNGAAVNGVAAIHKEGTTTSSTPLTQHGGTVMRDTVNIYYIWYGNWSTSSAQPILTNLAQNIGGSAYFGINKDYYDDSGSVSGAVTYGGSTTDDYSHGSALSQADIEAVVSRSFDHGLPRDPNGVYFVLTSSDVTQTTSGGAFCKDYCGWHNYTTLQGTDIKYAFVGDPSSCLSACAAQTQSPNGNAGADAMASTIAHELSETVTDPHLNAWYDNDGDENADKCAWKFGSEYTVGGTRANVKLGSMDYLLQENWLNDGTNLCALSPLSKFSISFSDIDDEVFVWKGTDASSTANAIIHHALKTPKSFSLESAVGPFDMPKDITVKILNSGCFNSGGVINIVDGDQQIWSHNEAQLTRHCGWIYRVALRLNPDHTVNVLDEQACVNDFDAACER